MPRDSARLAGPSSGYHHKRQTQAGTRRNTPLSASQLFTALAGRPRRYGLRRRPTWRIPSALKMGERPARKWQGRGAVVHGPPTADGGQPHPHFHARAAAPARGNARRLHASAWRGAGRRARFAAREKWGSDRPARGRGAVRLSTGRQRRTVGNRIPISTPELPRRHAANCSHSAAESRHLSVRPPARASASWRRIGSDEPIGSGEPFGSPDPKSPSTGLNANAPRLAVGRTYFCEPGRYRQPE